MLIGLLRTRLKPTSPRGSTRRRPLGVVATVQSGRRLEPQLDGPGPRAFGTRIQKVPFPPHFQPSTNITKYTRETNPAVWLEDFRLACWAGGADDDYFIIQYLPICIGEYIRAWLKFLSPNSICSWTELKQVFIGNFQGTYVCPENP
jgi:hypothetical protein